MRMRVLLITFALLVLPINSVATPQAPDKLTYKGRTYHLFANPLESFYKEKESRPKFRIAPNAWSSDNWRGYVATWEVKDGYLYLAEIDSWVCGEDTPESCKKADLKELFGERYRDGMVKADWFSGELRVPEGVVLRYVHLGYVSLYERDFILNVESGKITGERVVDNTKKPIPPPNELERQELERMKKRGEKP